MKANELPIQASQYSVPYITISAVLPSTKIAEIYDMNMDSATGITPSCLQKDSKSRTERKIKRLMTFVATDTTFLFFDASVFCVPQRKLWLLPKDLTSSYSINKVSSYLQVTDSYNINNLTI